jgi:hypothetical protein
VGVLCKRERGRGRGSDNPEDDFRWCCARTCDAKAAAVP